MQVYPEYEKSEISQRKGRNFRKDGHKNEVWEGQSRGSKQGFQKQNEAAYRAKEGRFYSYGRGRPTGWPTPLYQIQKDDGGSSMAKAGAKGHGDKVFDKVERDIKGKGKEVSEVVLTGDSGTDLDDQMGDEDEDEDLLVEECEYTMEVNVIEDQVGEEAGNAGQKLINEAKIT